MSVWESILEKQNKNQVDYKKLIQKLYKILENKEKIIEKYGKLKVICKDLLNFYIQYLILVERNIE